MRSARPPQDRKFGCPKCDKKFFTPKDLRRHENTHLGLREHVCPQCHTRFGRKDHLTRHAKKSCSAVRAHQSASQTHASTKPIGAKPSPSLNHSLSHTHTLNHNHNHSLNHNQSLNHNHNRNLSLNHNHLSHLQPQQHPQPQHLYLQPTVYLGYCHACGHPAGTCKCKGAGKVLTGAADPLLFKPEAPQQRPTGTIPQDNYARALQQDSSPPSSCGANVLTTRFELDDYQLSSLDQQHPNNNNYNQHLVQNQNHHLSAQSQQIISSDHNHQHMHHISHQLHEMCVDNWNMVLDSHSNNCSSQTNQSAPVFGDTAFQTSGLSVNDDSIFNSVQEHVSEQQTGTVYGY